MIGLRAIYMVVSAMTPLYIALGLAFVSVKRWNMFQSIHVDAINRLNFYFILPFFSFHFITQINPYTMNYKFIAADLLGKCVVGVVLVVWVKCIPGGNFSTSITAFSLCSLTNALVVGVPLLKSMYGELGVNLVIQSSAIQLLLRFILMFLLELRKAKSSRQINSQSTRLTNSQKLNSIEMRDDTDLEENRELESRETMTKSPSFSQSTGQATEMREGGTVLKENIELESRETMDKPQSFFSIMRIVWVKMIQNPNVHAFGAGIVWTLVANRWHFEMPSIMQGSVLILSNAGSGIAMFTLGLFMAFQKRIIACGVRKTIIAMILRFVVGPASIGIGALAMGLRGNVLRVALIQAALPESITAFTCAQEYDLHADILSTAVILGTIVSLPVLISYFTILDVIR